ncbi:MAG TPA: DinB family protein, partial [Ktedonobacteraceae bacterium]
MTTAEKPFAKAHRKLVDARIQFLGQLAKFSKAELTQPAQGEEWTPIQVAQHLYIADGLILDELKRVQQEDNPLIAALEEEMSRQINAAEPPVSLDAVMAGMAARREALF